MWCFQFILLQICVCVLHKLELLGTKGFIAEYIYIFRGSVMGKWALISIPDEHKST